MLFPVTLINATLTSRGKMLSNITKLILLLLGVMVYGMIVFSAFIGVSVMYLTVTHQIQICEPPSEEP